MVRLCLPSQVVIFLPLDKIIEKTKKRKNSDKNTKWFCSVCIYEHQ